MKGKLNLADITRFVKLKAGTSLSGMLDANATAKGNLSTITKQQAGPFTANGFINITGLNYSSPDFPQPIRNSNIQIAFQNPDGLADHTLIQVPAAHIEIGSRSGGLSTSPSKHRYPTWFLMDGLKGSFNLANAKQFTQFPAGTTISGILAGDIAFSGNKQAIDKKEYDKINSSGTLNAEKYELYQ